MTILLADDDLEDRELFALAIAEIDSSIECLHATNGLEAIGILKSKRPDYIFLDINMPLMNGKDCLKRIKSNIEYGDVPVVMYSTTSSKSEIDDCLRRGASGFITKPGRFGELVKSLRNCLKEL